MLVVSTALAGDLEALKAAARRYVAADASRPEGFQLFPRESQGPVSMRLLK